MKLDIGAGYNPKKGFKSVDRCDGADFYCDLESDKLPFDTESVDEIHTQHTLEHIKNLIHLMNEIWRILKWGGKVKIIVPHCDSAIAYGDPTHVRFFNAQSMKYFEGYYTNKYKLNYGIKTAFKLIKSETKTIDSSIRAGETKPYFIEQSWILEKNKEYYEANKPIFTIEEKEYSSEEMVKKIFKEAYELFCKKNQAYGNSYFEAEETLRIANLERKWARFKTYLKDSKNFEHESLEDTLMDLANYCIMEIAKRRLEK